MLVLIHSLCDCVPFWSIASQQLLIVAQVLPNILLDRTDQIIGAFGIKTVAIVIKKGGENL